MNFLIGVFLGMFVYGAWVGVYGPAILALLMAGFVYYARGHYARQDARWETMPQHAKQPMPVEHDLCKYECECMRDRL